jgi:polyisoprenoid-binding protein YceI
MRQPTHLRARLLASAALLILSGLSLARAQTAQPAIDPFLLMFDPAQCKVHYTVDSSLHTVHGTFNLKSGSVYVDPRSGKAGGDIIVYATSGDSGNSSRDEKMHKEVLESAKYPDVIFRPAQVDGNIPRPGDADLKLRGSLLLHGAEHEIVVPVHAKVDWTHWTGTANFDVPFIQWGMKDPSNWLLKVKPVVHIELELAGQTKDALSERSWSITGPKPN